jgi:hypothetical protein
MGWDSFTRRIFFDVGDGRRVPFRQDIWCGEEPLRFIVINLFISAEVRKPKW